MSRTPSTAGQVADAAVRARALDPGASFIVQAPAGSGKTELLTRRVLRLLATANEPEEIVAITFTKKAAAEMRARVHDAIRDEAAGVPPRDEHVAETRHLAKAALERSRERGWSLESSPQRLRVMTIDALCAAIVQQSPLLSGAGGAANVVEDASTLYREAARATLALIEEERYAAVRATLLHYDNQVFTVEQQLVKLLGKRDQWLAELESKSPRAQREAMEAVLRAEIDEALRPLARLPANLARQWQELARKSMPALPHNLRADADHLQFWQDMIGLVMTRKSEWRKQGAGQLVADLSLVPGLEAQLGRIRALPPPQFSDTQWSTLQDLLACMSLAATQLRYVFRDRGAVDFTEVARQAVAALGDDTEPSDLALRLDYRIRHLLVDEFQDTSRVQWALLERLTAGWQPGDGRTLFLVGDPMQSIYRFREAEVGLFLEAQRQGIGDIRLESLQLSTNFRSHPHLVEWFNATFSRVFPGDADVALGAVPYTASVARPKDGGAEVVVHAAVDREPSAEAAEILALIARLRSTDPEARIAILARSRSHLEGIADGLRAARTAYQAIEIEQLHERAIVTELRALTRALCHPADRIAWLAVLRAPSCGLTLADLREIAQAPVAANAPNAPGVPASASRPNAAPAPILASLRERAPRLSEDGRRRLARVLPILEAALALSGRAPLRRRVEDTWVALGGPACAASEADLLDARNFLRVLERASRGGELNGLRELDELLAEKRAAANPDAAATLQLMTIHRAKGLEFDHVIVPSLGRSTGDRDQPPLQWTTMPRADRSGEIGFLMAPVGATGGDKDAVYQFVGEIEKEKERLEEGRLLYVAATRAKRQLHLFASVSMGKDGPSKPPSDSMLRRLWPAVEEQFAGLEPQAADQDRRASAPPSPPGFRRLASDWTAPAARPAPTFVTPPEAIEPREEIVFDWAGHVARVVGTLAHRYLQQVSEEGLARWDAARIAKLAPIVVAELAAEGLDPSDCNAACERVLDALRNTIADERGRWLLQQRIDARNELAIATVVGNAVREFRVDRTFVDENGTRWIVDYKTSSHEGGAAEEFLDREVQRYKAQLDNYAALLTQIEPRPVKLGLYFPLLKAWRSWDFGQAPKSLTRADQLSLPI